MFTDKEIKDKVLAYWDDYTNELTKTLTEGITRYADKTGWKLGDPSILGIRLPEFTNKNLKINKGDLQIYKGFSEIEAKLAETILSSYAPNIETILQTDCSRTLGGMFKNGGAFPFLIKARNHAIYQHKKYREVHAKTLTLLKKQFKKIPPHSPVENINIFQEAINKVEYLHKFSRALIDYLEKEWLASIGLDKNVLKNPTKHHSWSPVIETAYRVLTKETQPPFTHTAACNYIAKLLTSIYPNIWKDDVMIIAGRIRTRLDNMNPRLANQK